MDQHFGALLNGRDAIDDGDPNPRGQNLSRLSIAFAALTGFFVVLRLVTRYFHAKFFGPDDGLIVAAMVCIFNPWPFVSTISDLAARPLLSA